MLDIDKDWIPVILAIVGPSLLGIGWWFKTRREDRLAKELEWKTKELAHLAKIEELQNKLSDWQQKRIADEENKRREVDVSNKVLLEISNLLKAALADKDNP